MFNLVSQLTHKTLNKPCHHEVSVAKLKISTEETQQLELKEGEENRNRSRNSDSFFRHDNGRRLRTLHEK